MPSTLMPDRTFGGTTLVKITTYLLKEHYDDPVPDDGGCHHCQG